MSKLLSLAGAASLFASANAACECKKPMDIVNNMPMEDGKYKYTEGSSSWLLPTEYGGSCLGWDAEPMSAGFAGGWGCPADWCSDKWCYVDPCECSDYAIGETMMFTGVPLFFSYGFCCSGFATEQECSGVGAGECSWNQATSSCDQNDPFTYINNRCHSKGTSQAVCETYGSCEWDAFQIGCVAKTVANRTAALGCPTPAPTSTDADHAWRFAYASLPSWIALVSSMGFASIMF